MIPAVILAAGRGSRLRRQAPDDPELSPRQAAAAAAGAKGVVPLLGRSLLERQLGILREVGVREVCVVVGPGADLIRTHLESLPRGDMDLRFAVQETPTGSAGALLAARDLVGERSCLVLNGDNLYPMASLRRLVAAEGDAALCFRATGLIREGGMPPERVGAFALVEVDGAGLLQELREKPGGDAVAKGGPEALVSMNCWRFTPGIFDACARVGPSVRGEAELPAAVLLRVREEGVGVRVLTSAEGVLDLTCRADIPRLERLLAQGSRAWVPEGRPAGTGRGHGRPSEFSLFAPGRIELVGKHTDYAGGRSLVVATLQGISVAGRIRRRDGDGEGGGPGCLVVHDRDRRKRAVFALGVGDGTSRESGPEGARIPLWERYPAAVVSSLVQDVPGLGNVPVEVELELTSTLPRAAGMSSSSALTVAAALGLLRGALGPPPWTGPWASAGEVREQAPDLGSEVGVRLKMAEYLAAVERGGAHTEGGCQDHAAILLGNQGAALKLAYRPARLEAVVPFPRDFVLAVAVSGVAAPKAGAARDRYNALSRETGRLAALWRETTGRSEPHLGAILRLGSGAGSRDVDDLLRQARRVEARLAEAGVPETLLRRFRQFWRECLQVVPAAAWYLGGLDVPTQEARTSAERLHLTPLSDPSPDAHRPLVPPERRLTLLGRAVHRSQRMAEEVLGNQVPETRFLVRSARWLGAPAASAFGAGFGGAVWALVPKAEAQVFLDRWATHYRAHFPETRSDEAFLLTEAGPGAHFRGEEGLLGFAGPGTGR